MNVHNASPAHGTEATHYKPESGRRTCSEIIEVLDALEAQVAFGQEVRPSSQRGEFASGYDKGFADCLEHVRECLMLAFVYREEGEK